MLALDGAAGIAPDGLQVVRYSHYFPCPIFWKERWKEAKMPFWFRFFLFKHHLNPWSFMVPAYNWIDLYKRLQQKYL